MSQQEWRERILLELGDEGVDVELTTRQLDASIRRALELWDRFKPPKRQFPLEVPAAETVVYDFLAEPENTDNRLWPRTHIRNVLDVTFQDQDRRITGPRAGFLEGYYLRWGYQGPRLFFQLHMAERRYERLTGSRPDWYWDCEERKLYIASPSRDLRAMVTATRETLPEDIQYFDEGRFLQAACARAKLILARVLGPEIPGPAGPIPTDADNLRTEGKEEWEKIEEQLATALTSVPPPTWRG